MEITRENATISQVIHFTTSGYTAFYDKCTKGEIGFHNMREFFANLGTRSGFNSYVNTTKEKIKLLKFLFLG